MGEYAELALEYAMEDKGIFGDSQTLKLVLSRVLKDTKVILVNEEGQTIPEKATFSEWRLYGYGVYKGEKATWIDGIPMFFKNQVGRIRR